MRIALFVVIAPRMPVGLRRHLSLINMNHSWIAEEGREVYESAAVHGFHEDASPLAGSPAFDEFTEGCLEEGLFAEMCPPIHDITSVVDVKSFSRVV